jgi:hypothetical protein
MNIDIDKNFDQLLKDKQIEYDQKQYDLVKVLAQKNKIFHKFTYKSSIYRKNSELANGLPQKACIYMVKLEEVNQC